MTKGLFSFFKREKAAEPQQPTEIIREVVNTRSPEEDYQDWIKRKESYATREVLTYNPKITIILPFRDESISSLRDSMETIDEQEYTNYECIVLDMQKDSDVKEVIDGLHLGNQFRIAYLDYHVPLVHALNSGLSLVSGEYVTFLEAGDLLAPNALYEVGRALNYNSDNDLIYSDEDKYGVYGRHTPFFKPDWSPDTFLAFNYIGRLSVFRNSIVKRIGGLQPVDNPEYDFLMRFVEQTNNSNVAHISKVLYHRHEDRPDYDHKAYLARKLMIQRRELDAKIVNDGDVELIEYKVPATTRVSIIIPSKDNENVLLRNILAIKENTVGVEYEIVVVDNGSKEETRKLIKTFLSGTPGRYIYRPMAFNFSKMCNIGANNSCGNVLLFLNDDIEINSSDWLVKLVGQALQPDTGAVSAKLLYPDSNRIQHCGVISIGNGPCLALQNFEDDKDYYFGRNIYTYNYLAVTGACLAIEKKKFDEVGGFNENLVVAYNDIDLCLKLYEEGYYNVVRNDTRLVKLGTTGQGVVEDAEELNNRLLQERDYLYANHQYILDRDPFYNRNLTKDKVDFSINNG